MNVFGKSIFILETEINHVCTYESPLISATHELVFSDNDIGDTVFILESPRLINYGVPVSNGVVFLSDELYLFQHENKGDNKLQYLFECSIPYQGSWVADSAYFFTNLVSFELHLNGKKPK